MSYHLCQFLMDIYEYRNTNPSRKVPYYNIPIQIDDQDDNDILDDFCNIFLTIKPKNSFKIELIGKFPITKELSELADKYRGFSDPIFGKLTLFLDINQTDVLLQLADYIRKTSFLGSIIQNNNWLAVSSRTISSLFRFVRIITEYKNCYSK